MRRLEEKDGPSNRTATGREVEPADKGMWYGRDVQSSVLSSCLGSDVNLYSGILWREIIGAVLNLGKKSVKRPPNSAVVDFT